MDDQAKAKYDDSLINDSDYYKVGQGYFSISIKYLFLMSVGGYLFMLAASEDKDPDNFCPNSYKMKKIQLSEDQEKALNSTEDLTQDNNTEVAWVRKYVKPSESSLYGKDKNKGIYGDKLL